MSQTLSSPTTSVVTEAHRKQFEEQGYFVLEGVVPAQHLQLLRDKVQQNIERLDARMDAEGVTKMGINHKGSRYFVQPYKDGDTEVAEFIFSDVMADVTRATLGDDVYLFHGTIRGQSRRKKAANLAGTKIRATSVTTTNRI